MTHHTDAELLPCPFCGAAPKIEGLGAVRWIKCPDDSACGSGGMAIGIPADDLARGIASWNRRAPAAPVPQGWKLVPEKGTEAMARAFRADDAPGYFCMTTLRCADFSERYVAMLAAAPRPPVQQVTPEMIEAAQEAYMPFGDMELAIQSALFAAPQLPEAQASVSNGTLAAPVQLPEPDAWRYTDARGHFRYRGARPGFAVEYPLLKPEALYTEQQVRDLLAAHGIQEQST